MTSENALIASLALDPSGLAKAPMVSEEDFASSACRTLFRVMRGMHEANQPINIVTLGDFLGRSGLLDRVGGPQGLLGILDTVPSPAMLTHYSTLVVKASVARRIHEIKCAPIPKDQEIDDYATELASRISEQQLRLSGIARQDEISGQCAVDMAFDKIEQAYLKSAIGGLPATPRVSIDPIDQATGGFEPGEMWVLAGAAKIGKSMLGVQVLANWVIDQEKSAYVASMEMSATQYATRIIAHESAVNLDRLTECDFPRLSSAFSRVGKACHARLTVLQNRNTTVEAITNRILAKAQKPELLIVDYLQLLKPSDHRQDRHLQVAHISHRLKELAERANLAVVVLSQLNDDGRTRESRVIEQDCDGLIRIEKTDDEDHVWLNLDLHRDGKACRVYCDALRSISTFRVSRDQPPEPTHAKHRRF